MPYLQNSNDWIMKLSPNTRAYYDYWKETLHKNNCHANQHCLKLCVDGARNLTLERLENIKRGMPDFSSEEENRIWMIAFELHEKHSGRGGVIAPSWGVDAHGNALPNRCDCFEKAIFRLAEVKQIQAVEQAPVQVTEEDRWYEPRFE